MSRPVIIVVELAVAGVVLVFAANSHALAASASPKVAVSPVIASPGDQVVVQLANWPDGTVQVGVCGNDARRGSEDCAVTGDEALTINGAAPRLVQLTLAVPPVPCPCVIRATTPANDIEVTTPIDVRGVPVGQPIAPSGPAPAAQLGVDASLERSPSGFPSSWAPAFGLSVHEQLVVKLRNRGLTPVTGLRVAAELGRNGNSGTPLPVRTVAVVAPGAERVVRIPVTLSAPAFGKYVVHGTVYGLSSPRHFTTDTHNEPWAFELMVPIVLLVLAQVRRRNDRARRRRQEAALAAASVVDPSAGPTPGAAAPLVPVDDPIAWHLDTAQDHDVLSLQSMNEPASVGATGGSPR